MTSITPKGRNNRSSEGPRPPKWFGGATDDPLTNGWRNRRDARVVFVPVTDVTRCIASWPVAGQSRPGTESGILMTVSRAPSTPLRLVRRSPASAGPPSQPGTDSGSLARARASPADRRAAEWGVTGITSVLSGSRAPARRPYPSDHVTSPFKARDPVPVTRPYSPTLTLGPGPAGGIPSSS